MNMIHTNKGNRPLQSFIVKFVLICTMVFVLLPGLAPQSALAADANETATDVGLGFASFLTTLPYGAVKIAYAGIGAIIGGFTYALTAGDLDSANVVWEKSLLGTYVITPDHLTGDKQIRFIGP